MVELTWTWNNGEKAKELLTLLPTGQAQAKRDPVAFAQIRERFDEQRVAGVQGLALTTLSFDKEGKQRITQSLRSRFKLAAALIESCPVDRMTSTE
jgi:hypothetical protein